MEDIEKREWDSNILKRYAWVIGKEEENFYLPDWKN